MRRFSVYLILAAACFGAGAAAVLWAHPWTMAVPLEDYTNLPLEGSVGSTGNVFDPQTWESATVSRVIDGDTVELVGGERLRLIGIDAPERGTCFADESADILEFSISGKVLRLEPGMSERDRYGRRLGYLHDGETFINQLLVTRGAAIAKEYPPDTIYAASFSREQAQASAAGRGLWGLCGGLHDAGAIDPETNEQEPPSADCAIKGNISSSGEHIYHVAGCGSYERTKIDVHAGERWFCAEADAQAAGWRKAGNCP